MHAPDDEDRGLWRLDGRRALVTGGSKGIGAAAVAELRRRGAVVLRVARSLDGAEPADGLVDLAADCSTDAGRAAVLAAAADLGGLDVLVNNVGTNLRKPTADWTPDDFRRLFDANLQSAWELCRGLLPMLAAARGCVVNVSSVSGARVTLSSTGPYGMTKAAMDQMTRWLACEWGPLGVRVNSVQPWYVRTPLTVPVLSDAAKRERILGVTPLGRLGEPEDVARAIAFLALPAAGWITGVSLPVDGGFLALGM